MCLEERCVILFQKTSGQGVTDPWTADVPGTEFPTGGTARERASVDPVSRRNDARIPEPTV